MHYYSYLLCRTRTKETGSHSLLPSHALVRCEVAQCSHCRAQRLAHKTLTRLLYVFFERWRFSAAGLTDAQQLFTTSVKMLPLLGPQLHLLPASPGPCTTALLLPFTKPLYSAEVEVGHEFIPYLPRPSLSTHSHSTHMHVYPCDATRVPLCSSVSLHSHSSHTLVRTQGNRSRQHRDITDERLLATIQRPLPPATSHRATHTHTQTER